ncbi:IS66 family insertion sequence element accessory protein TnpA [Bathymodiolus platifrons methanotrophic gill symbiont]|uniref:IS66 family insertion sequence element accessory protein TnpA n=1 Tax=Bathymodiolus platifrons methanotrophic gill symbiont TaxID=113268 RepID=UPI001C8E04C2|nr:hypothetical protein [Bathymodiolus platifrons methanotrophic gill symbiont]
MADYCFQLTQEALMSPSQNKSAMQDPIPQWQASSLTQVEYCKAHDIKPHIFSYYKKQFSSAIIAPQRVKTDFSTILIPYS